MYNVKCREQRCRGQPSKGDLVLESGQPTCKLYRAFNTCALLVNCLLGPTPPRATLLQQLMMLLQEFPNHGSPHQQLHRG